jgi:hypothetical protein
MVDVVEGVLGYLWISDHDVIREPRLAGKAAWYEVLLSFNVVLNNCLKFWGSVHLILNFLYPFEGLNSSDAISFYLSLFLILHFEVTFLLIFV